MSTTNVKSYELFYFSLSGRGEVIRFLLQYGKVNWTERHPTNWAEEKATTLFEQLPVLTEFQEDGSKFELGESHAIERYLAQKFDLMGSNPHEAAHIDSFTEGWFSMLNSLVQIRFGKSPEAKETGKVNFPAAVEFILKHHEAQLEKNGTGYYVGSRLSLVDIVAYNMIQITKAFGFDSFANAKGLNKLCDLVKNHENIGSYAQERLSVHTPLN
ncbi:hypothetical protein K7432_007405 [Basidiobolus ranarum]|uniref:glutathione transferase n=1 Tax=Basidiobolus ranarum TaxID=34480 RepID=A0ABR2WTJ1_9FUNG